MIIIRAGLTGLLCGAMNPGSTIFEAKKECDIEHEAIFRMKSDIISQQTGIAFKKVNVTKAIWFDGEEVLPTPRMIHLYSKKVSDQFTDRSISNIDSCIRYIPPENFVEQLKKKVHFIKYEADFPLKDNGPHPVISTLHLPVILEKLGEKQIFSMTEKVNPIYVNKFRIADCDSYSTIYYPDPDLSIYRASLNGNVLIIESMEELSGKENFIVMESLGIVGYFGNCFLKNHKQVFGKINEINEVARSRTILDLTMKYNIYSLGRFATWRPSVMMDDIVKDISVIHRLIEQGNYAANLYKQNKEYNEKD